MKAALAADKESGRMMQYLKMEVVTQKDQTFYDWCKYQNILSLPRIIT